ncbi:MAG: acylphosphatase [Gammaproteobacteria bacterium]
MTSKQIFISGRVQGVFFRDSTRQKAAELNLKGGVRNCRDGRVEVLVTGRDADIELLIKWLKIGPKYAKVSTIEVMDLPAAYLPDSQKECFDIWPTK